MSGTINPGDLVTAIKTIVAADYDAQRVAVAALYTDGVTLLNMQAIYRAALEQYQSSPSLVVTAIGSGYDYDETDFLDGVPCRRYHDIVMEMIIWGNQQTATLLPREYLELQIERQMLALENTMTAKPRLTVGVTHNADRLYVQDVQYVDVNTAPKMPLQIRAILTTRVNTSIE